MMVNPNNVCDEDDLTTIKDSRLMIEMNHRRTQGEENDILHTLLFEVKSIRILIPKRRLKTNK